ncbi:MAG TPA: ATP-dependent sacrificial sulfur transferase LarE [Anaerolineaceae bacterium]|nr:ATP-dependent sacrificial sulfur transferase LarE [Anaerolineaceae bacterium]
MNLPEKALTLPQDLLARWNLLLNYFEKQRSVLVAFSGGVDSALLCAAAFAALGNRMLALTIHSPVESTESIEVAKAHAAQIGFPHQVIEYNDLDNPRFVANPPERCYICKKGRFEKLIDYGKHEGFVTLVEGTNADDEDDYRPGRKAVLELGIQSPLLDLGFTKTEIRELLKGLGLSIWNRPSAPCFATRFPYGSPVTREGLLQISSGEAFMRDLGFDAVRVRHLGDTVKLEVDPAQFEGYITHRRQILEFFTTLGFQYITADLAGYRRGSLNEVLK